MLRIRNLRSGTTQTLEAFWNTTGTAFFRAPAGARISVKYGKGRLSVNRQVQILDGESVKKLSVGVGSLVYARMRMKVPHDTEVTYDIYPGDVAVTTPEQRF